MFKFVVLCVFAAALAEPEPGYFYNAPYYQPFAYSAAVYPGSTTITKSASSVIHPSPYAYSAPIYSHFIKKRSAEPQPEPEPEAKPEPQVPFGYVSPYSYPYSYPYVKSAPVVSTSVYNAPVVTPYANYPYAAAHFIKKRSAPYFPYSAYPYYAPSTYIASSPVIATRTPLYPAVDLPVAQYTAAHLIKKRSAPLFPATYVAPSTYVAPALPTTSYYSNIAYPGYYNYNYNYPIAAASTHFIKKRSAPLLPAATYIAPTTYAASTPFVTPTYAANPFYSTPYYANPYLYSTYIKK